MKTRLSGLQAEAVELNQSQSMGMCIVIGSSFQLRQSGFYWTVSDGEQSWKKMEKSLLFRFWFSQGHKHSYDSAYDSANSITSENQP